MILTLDNIRSDDPLQRARGETFLLENPDQGVRLRPNDQFNRAIESGQGVLVRDADGICGISLVYQYDPGAGWPVSYEIGTMRVTAAGYRLQVFLAQFHLVQIYLEDDATRGDIFAVVTAGTASEHNLLKHVGLRPWQPGELLTLLRSEAGVPFAAGKPVLVADMTAIARAFTTLKSLHISGTQFRAPKGDAIIDVTPGWFSASLLDQGP